MTIRETLLLRAVAAVFILGAVAAYLAIRGGPDSGPPDSPPEALDLVGGAWIAYEDLQSRPIWTECGNVPPDAQCDSTGTCVLYDPVESEAWGAGEKPPHLVFSYWFGRRDLTDAEVEPLYRELVTEALGPMWPEVDGD